ncbi:MAG: ABC transporter transmembrane domain-containing protein [Tabrizicola sp.]|jgi:ABC-type multidrug transport system fused ATPase/permease subunit|nr:ABC transporter transmembrane domain-containing protein [Tabrizicola sp.]
MTVPPLFVRSQRAVWAGLAALSLGQAGALVAGIAGTRLAFAGLDGGAVPPLSIGLIAGAALALATLRPGLRLLAERLGQDQTRAVRAALLRNSMAASPEKLAARRRGYLMLRLTGDMTAFKDGIARSLPQVLQAATLIPGAILALWLVDFRFGMIGLSLAGLTLLAICLSQPSLRQAHAALRQERGKLAAGMAERLPIAPDLARLGRRQIELSRLATAGQALERRAVARLVRVEVLRALPGGLAGLSAVAVLLDGASQGLAAGEIAAALAAIGVMGHAVVELATAVDRMTGWKIARDNLAQHLLSDVVEPDWPRREQVRLAQARGALSVAGAADLIQPVAVTLAPGERAEVFGPDPERLVQSLSGQGTDARISVHLDGIPLADLSPGSIRRNMAVISPTPVLLKGSVRRNICLGLTSRPSDSRLTRRIEAVGLGLALDNVGGLEGPVPEGGRTLDQRDLLRLSALRAAVQCPQVLIVAIGGFPIPGDVRAYLARTEATVIRVGVTRSPIGVD